jgi:uncharacterized SAM-binding protein YcdF (DUF218 family)
MVDKIKHLLRLIFIITGIFCLLLVGFYVFRVPILSKIGNNLIRQDSLQANQADALFVLSGGAVERGAEAAKLMAKKSAKIAVCTGKLPYPVVKMLGIDLHEGQLTRYMMLKQGTDSTKVVLLEEGTSTYEEIHAILAYSKKHNYKQIIIVSSNFHTKRIHWLVDKIFHNQAIQVVVRGATAQTFDESRWWDFEDGLIFVNNEYIKSLYYAIKY